MMPDLQAITSQSPEQPTGQWHYHQAANWLFISAEKRWPLRVR